jgi:hypothetical protein
MRELKGLLQEDGYADGVDVRLSFRELEVLWCALSYAMRDTFKFIKSHSRIAVLTDVNFEELKILENMDETFSEMYRVRKEWVNKETQLG